MKSKKVYIAGKISGEKLAQCTMKFGAAQKELELLGFQVINPMELVTNFRTPWKKAMIKCLSALIKSDCIALLPDWIDSRGARLEAHIARELNLPIIDL